MWNFFKPPDIESMEKERDIDGLIKALRNKDVYIQRCAIDALGRIGDTQAIEPLIKTFATSNEIFTIVTALSSIGEPAITPLINALNDKNASIRCGAARTLREIGDKRAVDALINALHDREIHVAMEACYALGNIKDRRAIQPLIELVKNDTMSNIALANIEEFGTTAVTPLLIAYRTGNTLTKMHIWFSLMKMREKAVEPMINALTVDDELFLISIIEMLGNIGDSRAVHPLIETMRRNFVQNHPNVVYSLVDALSKIGINGETESTEALLQKALMDENEAVQWLSYTSLDTIKRRKSRVRKY